MGMFDWVQCDAPLPDGWEPHRGLYSDFSDGGFQTKSFECLLLTFTITAEGRLTVQGYGGAREEYEPEGVPYSGTFVFYGTDDHTDGGRWHEYAAEFQGGQLQGIVAHDRSGGA